MAEEVAQVSIDAEETETLTLRKRARTRAQRLWRPAVTTVVVAAALLLAWHVFYGQHGVSFWWQTRAQDRALQQEIKNLQQENAQMRGQIQKLQSDPNAIERVVRENLHYTKPGEVVYTAHDQPQGQKSQQQPQQTPTGK